MDEAADWISEGVCRGSDEMQQRSRYDSKAHRTFWSVHVEAWRRSGLSQRAYCDEHGLSRRRFSRWLKLFMDAEDVRKHAESLRKSRREQQARQRKKQGRKRLRPRYGARTDMDCRAVQAFWAMHVEAMNWSGMRLCDYAAALNLSPTSLRRWRDRLEEGAVEIDWRALLHPSARPKISSDVSSAAKDSLPETPLTEAREADRPADGRASRRSFTDGEKHSIVLESEQPGVDFPGKSGERFSVYAASASKRHGLLYPRAECRLIGL